jgi:hypothetical protein
MISARRRALASLTGQASFSNMSSRLVLNVRLYHPNTACRALWTVVREVRSEHEARANIDTIRRTVTGCDMFWAIVEADDAAGLSSSLVPRRVLACSIDED